MPESKIFPLVALLFHDQFVFGPYGIIQKKIYLTVLNVLLKHFNYVQRKNVCLRV